MTTIGEVTAHLERIAPPVYQESYDNAGLITGDASAAVTGVLCCLDATEEVVAEAERKGCNLIVAHHPIVFRGLKRLTGGNYVERTVIRAIRSGIAIYAIHTNLDNVYYQGVNARIAERLGLEETRILSPKPVGRRLRVLVPSERLGALTPLLEKAGARRIFASQNGHTASVEAYLSSGQEGGVKAVLQQMGLQDYELSAVDNADGQVGSGMVGRLPKPMDEKAFLDLLLERMRTPVVRHTPLSGKPVQTVALCGGSGSFLLPQAIRAGADVFVTADFKYHEFFDAEGKIVIADIGHFESEQFTIELLADIIGQNFSTFATHLTEVFTNPVRYHYHAPPANAGT